MRRGTTPTLKFNMSIDPTLIQSMSIAFAQNGVVKFNKTLEDVTIVDKVVSLKLSQSETLSLQSRDTVEIQIRVLFTDETADASDIIRVYVDEILKDGVLS